MTNSRHLKRHSMPNAWSVKKKGIPFITRPNPGSHNQKYSVPIIVLLRDLLGSVSTRFEVKYVLEKTEVLVNNKRIKDVRAVCGLFDIVELKASSQKYTLIFDTLGKFKLIEVKDDNIYSRILSKSIMPGKKYQINLENGYNILVDEKTFKGSKVSDTIIYDTSKRKIVGSVALKEGSFVYVFDGKYKGNLGELKGMTKFNGLAIDTASVLIDGVDHSTAINYCIAIGSKKEDTKRFN